MKKLNSRKARPVSQISITIVSLLLLNSTVFLGSEEESGWSFEPTNKPTISFHEDHEQEEEENAHQKNLATPSGLPGSDAFSSDEDENDYNGSTAPSGHKPDFHFGPDQENNDEVNLTNPSSLPASNAFGSSEPNEAEEHTQPSSSVKHSSLPASHDFHDSSLDQGDSDQDDSDQDSLSTEPNGMSTDFSKDLSESDKTNDLSSKEQLLKERLESFLQETPTQLGLRLIDNDEDFEDIEQTWKSKNGTTYEIYKNGNIEKIDEISRAATLIGKIDMQEAAPKSSPSSDDFVQDSSDDQSEEPAEDHEMSQNDSQAEIPKAIESFKTQLDNIEDLVSKGTVKAEKALEQSEILIKKTIRNFISENSSEAKTVLQDFAKQKEKAQKDLRGAKPEDRPKIIKGFFAKILDLLTNFFKNLRVKK